MNKWLAKALTADNPQAKGFRSDYDLNGGIKELDLSGVQLRRAAVLVPIVDYEDEVTILLTRRADHLKKHPGQVSFPGGSVDPGDKNVVAAALREAEEEIGLHPSFVSIKGYLDGYRTGTGFEIVPVVGLVKPGFVLSPQEAEVADIFEVPLSYFLDKNNFSLEKAFWQGHERAYYSMKYKGFTIWGATAAMLINLVDVLKAVE